MGNTFFKISLLPEAIFCWKRLASLNAPRKMIERANASIESAEALLSQWASVGMKATISDAFIVKLAGAMVSPPEPYTEVGLVAESAETESPRIEPDSSPAASVSMNSLAELRSCRVRKNRPYKMPLILFLLAHRPIDCSTSKVLSNRCHRQICSGKVNIFNRSLAQPTKRRRCLHSRGYWQTNMLSRLFLQMVR